MLRFDLNIDRHGLADAGDRFSSRSKHQIEITPIVPRGLHPGLADSGGNNSHVASIARCPSASGCCSAAAPWRGPTSRLRKKARQGVLLEAQEQRPTRRRRRVRPAPRLAGVAGHHLGTQLQVYLPNDVKPTATCSCGTRAARPNAGTIGLRHGPWRRR